MSRPPTPTKIHEITGAYKKDPKRRPTNEATPKAGIGQCPEDPSANWRDCWDELVGIVCPGVLGDADRIWLERAAKLLAESRKLDNERWTGAKETALMQYLSRMGLNPSDRARLSVKGNDRKDPADEYF